MPPEQNPNLILVPQNEAAVRLSISQRKLHDERVAGRIIAVRIGAKVLYRVAELERFASECQAIHQ